MDRTTTKRLLDYLATYSRAYPGIWDMAETLRLNADEWGGTIPPWCYLPATAWMALVEQKHGPLTPASAPVFITNMASLAALSGWRYTQGIYRFHPTIFSALMGTSPLGDMPVDVLSRLPEWCIYLEIPNGIPGAFDGIRGAFVHLDYISDDARRDLRILLDFGDRVGQPLVVELGAWHIAEGIERTRAAIAAEYPEVAGELDADFIARATATITAIIPLCLYICSDEPDIDGHTPGSRPHYASYTRTKRGLRLFPPDKPRVWRIGEETGAAIERGRVAASASGSERKGPRPHMRRAHWHGFWSGAIKQRPGEEKQPERRFCYKWLPPIVVGLGDDDGE